MYFFLRGLMRMLVRIFLVRGKLHVEGLSRVPRRGGVLIVGNHFSAIDPPLTGSLLRRRDVYYMAKSESFIRPVKRWILTNYNAFPVVRGTADRSALKHAIGLLRGGHVVCVYPEGSRSPDAQMQRPHAGAGFLARQTETIVVPVAIWGSQNALPKGTILPRRRDVYVRFGEPFRLQPLAADGTRLRNQEAADEMMRRVAELMPEEHRGVYHDEETMRASSPPAA